MVYQIGRAETAWESRKQSVVGGGSNTLRAGERKATSEGTWQKSWIHKRDKAPVLGRVEEKEWAVIEYSTHHSELTCPPAIRKLCFPVYPPSLTPCSCAGSETACHPGGLATPFVGSWPPQGLSLPWPTCPLEGLQLHGAAPSTTSPLENDRSPEKPEQALAGPATSASIRRQSSQFSCPGEEPLGFSVAQLAAPTLGGCCTPVEKLPSTTSTLQEPPQPRKARTGSAWPCNICLHPEAVLPIQLPWGRAHWVLSGPASRLHPRGVAALLGNSCPGLPVPCKSPRSPEKLEQARTCHATSAFILRQSSQFSCPGEEPLGFSVAQLSAPTLVGMLNFRGTAAQNFQTTGRAPQPKNTRASSAWPCEICFHLGADLPGLSALRKSSLLQRDPVSPAHPNKKPHHLKEDDQKCQPSGNIP